MEKTENKELTSDTETGHLLQNESIEKSYLKTATGVIAVFSAVILFCISATSVQLLERRIPDLELNTFRSGIPLIFYSTILLVIKRWPIIERSQFAATLAYSLGISCSALSQFIAVSFLPAAAAFCVCCASAIIWGLFIFALCWNERVTMKKVLFACLCICGVILVVQPWAHLEGHNQKWMIEKENSTDGDPYKLNGTMSSVQNSSYQTKEEMDVINISLCEQNLSDKMKRSQTDSGQFMSEMFGYTAAASSGIFIGLYVTVLKKNPYINEHPFKILFWCWSFGTTISLIIMFFIETPVLPSNWFDIAMVIIHGATCAVIWPLIIYGSGIITGNTVTIIFSTKSVFMLIAQYTVLSSILPGHRNWIEVLGVVLVLLGSSLSSALEILADTKLLSCLKDK